MPDQQRQADGGEHHREGGKGIAHHHGEQRHAESEGDGRAEDTAIGDGIAHDIANDISHASECEYRAEAGEHLRQYRRPTDAIRQPPPAVERLGGARLQPRIADGQRDDDAQREADQRDLPGIDQLRKGREQQSPAQRDGGDDQRQQEQPVAVANSAGAALGGIVWRGPALHLAGPGNGDQRQHQNAVTEIAEPVAR